MNDGPSTSITPNPPSPQGTSRDGLPFTVGVIGGGISGLATARALATRIGGRERAIDVTLYEASPRFGGVIHTEHRDGFLLEHGPDCFISTKPEGLALARELGLESEMIGTREGFRRSFIVHRGVLKPLPRGFFLIAPTSIKALLRTPIVSWRGKLRMAMELFVPPRPALGDESLASFVRRRFGKEALERIAQPMVAGIYTADPEKLGLAATFPNFLEMERAHGSVIRALRRQQSGGAARDDAGARDASGPRYGMFVSFRRGMERLAQAALEDMPAARLRPRTTVSRLEPVPGGRWQVVADGADPSRPAAPELFDALVVALPAPQAMRLFTAGGPPNISGVAAALGTIPYATPMIVNLAFERERIAHPLNGMGFVVPAVEKYDILACSFSGVKFEGRAPANKALLRVFMGGELRPDLAGRSDDELTRLALADVRSLLGASGAPIFSTVTRWPRSMAQYHVGHPELVRDLRSRLRSCPGLFLTGNAYEGVGIPDCIRQGQETARAVVEYLGAKP